ncbi:MAG: HD domain-containing protein [Lachnospiraceae bacterium]|nr:HD domain-containing protein [Lachnospiraceae bacterium]
MDKIAKFYSMETGVEKEMVLLVMGVRDKGFTKKGEPFVAVDLFDGVKTQPVNFFSETIDSMREKGVISGSILKLNLTHGSAGYYNQSHWELNTDSSITEKDFVHAAPINPDKYFEGLIDRVSSVDSNPEGVGPYKSISSLAVKLLLENKDAFKRSSAAVSMHHNFLSGLLYHTVRMVCLASHFCDVYKGLDKELLVCAAALHDIGKISCYETLDVGEANVTVEGRLLEHSVVGIMMIHDAAKEDVYNPEKIEMLKHMIASHHGKKEWDAITTPAFPEAEMLHIIDLADSRMNMFEEAYKGQEPGTISEEKVYGLENSYIYKPMYNEAWG